MNIILFHRSEVEHPLARYDARARHLLDVLRRRAGDTFDAGIMDGPSGKGTLIAINELTLELSFDWTKPAETLPPLHVLIGLPRPQSARHILRDLSTLGVAGIHFFRSDKGEASYASSSLWQSDEWRRHVIDGTAQAFSTRLPEVTHSPSLATALPTLPIPSDRVAFDNYEASQSVTNLPIGTVDRVHLALGAERGWSASERSLLRTSGFVFAHFGTRVLRAETACVVATALIKAKLGWL